MMQTSQYRNRNLLPVCNYEDYHDEGYDDDQTPYVTPKGIFSALSNSLQTGSSDLDEVLEKLFATRLQLSSNPAIEGFSASALFHTENS